MDTKVRHRWSVRQCIERNAQNASKIKNIIPSFLGNEDMYRSDGSQIAHLERACDDARSVHFSRLEMIYTDGQSDSVKLTRHGAESFGAT